MKKTFLLLHYASFLAFLFNLGNPVYSQIIYTDIPDATPSATYPLDLNNDTIDDFLIQFQSANKIVCIPQNNNAYAGDFDGSSHLPWAFPASVSICDTLATWYDSTSPGTMAWGTNLGYWVGATDKFLALKLIVGANIHYGWARFDVFGSSSSFTVKDYAYNSIPNTCIQSGQIALNTTESHSGNIYSISPNPFITSTTITTSGNFKNAGLTIYNSFGQTLKEVKNISGHTVFLDRENFPVGLYFLQLAEGDKVIFTKRVFVMD